MSSLLERVWGDSTGFVEIKVGPLYTKGAPHDTRFFQWPSQEPEIASYVEDNRAKDVYFSTPLLNSPKRNKETATVTHALYVDADTCEPSNFRVPPTVVVETRPGRYHCYWMLDQAYIAQDVSRVAHRLCVAHKDQGCDPSGWPVAKLLRVPDTSNLKYDGQFDVVIIQDTGEVFTLEVLEEAYSDVDLAPEVTFAEEELPELPELMSVLERLDFHHLATYRADPRDGQDWSAFRWRFSLDLFRDGFDAPSVFVLVKNTRFNKYERDGRPDTDLWKEILKAQATVVDEQSAAALLTVQEREKSAFVVSFLSPDERDLVNQMHTFTDEFEEWVADKSPLAAHKYSRFMSWMVLSAVYGSWVRIYPRFGKTPTNLWGLLLGPSSTTKKSTVVNLGLAVLRQWDKIAPEEQRGFYVGSDFTGEGLNNKLAERDGYVSFSVRDEIHGFFKEIFTKTYLSGTVERMTGLYDGRVMMTLRASSGASQKKDATTVFCFLGLGIEGLTAAALTTEHFDSGFLPRTLWCVVDAPDWDETQEWLDQGDDLLDNTQDETVTEWLKQFQHGEELWNGSTFDDGPKTIRFDDDALARWNEFGVYTKRLILGHDMEPLIEASRMRMTISVWKAAGLLAAHDLSSTIQLHHLLYVLREAEEWFRDLVRMAGCVSASNFEAKVNEVEAFIAGHKRPVHQSTVYRRYASIRKAEVDELIIALRAQGRVTGMEGMLEIVGNDNG